jgi:hypothetical protein
MPIATMSSKGQLTIPKAVREALRGAKRAHQLPGGGVARWTEEDSLPLAA